MTVKSKKLTLKNILSWQSLLVAVIFGTASVLTVISGFHFYIPGTGALSDPREIFNSLGAAISGPVGGLIIGFISTFFGQATDLKLYSIFQHLMSAVWIGWGYKKLVYERYKMPNMVFGWLFLMFVYSFIIYLPGLIILHVFFNPLFQKFVGGQFTLWQAIIKLYGGWMPEIVLTTIYTTLVLIALPDKYRKPLWGSPIENRSDKRKEGRALLQKLFLKNFIAIRLSIWFVLLFSIPLVFLSIANRNYFLDYFLRNEALQQYEAAHHIASLLDKSTDANILKTVLEINKNGERTILLMDRNLKNYPNSGDETKKGFLFSNLNEEKKNQILTDESGSLIDVKNRVGIGFSGFRNNRIFVISISKSVKYDADLDKLLLFIYRNISVTLTIITILSAGIIWIIIGIPLNKLRAVANEIGRRNYDVKLDPLEMTDEIRTLASAVNQMKSNIQIAEKEIVDSELKFRLIFETAHDAIFILKDDLFTDCNSKTVELFGCGKDQLINRSVLEFSPEHQFDGKKSRIKFFEKIETALSGTSQFFEWTLTKLDGTLFEVEISLDRIELKDGFFLQTIVRDITERKDNELRLKENEEKYRNLFNFSPDPIFVHKNGKMLFINSAGIKLFGAQNQDEIIGRNFLDFVHPEYHNTVKERVNKLHDGSDKLSLIEEKFVKVDGSIIDVEVSTISFLEEGEFAAQVVARDITERKIAEKRLVESEGKFRSIFESASVAILILGLDQKIIQANKAFSEMLGFTEDEVKGQSILDLTFHDDREDSKSRINNIVLNSKDERLVEKRYYHKSGKLIWGIASGMIVKDENGNPLYVVGLIQDITERVVANENLRKLSRAVEQSPSSIIITDLSGTIEYVNPKFIKVTGYSFEEAIGQNPRVLKSGTQSKDFYQNMWNALAAGKDWQGEFHNKKKSGELFWEFASISPIKNEAGKITNFLAVKEDITEWKRVQGELVRSKEEAEEASKLKSSLLANMSHEFRTPLNGVLGFSQLLKDEINDLDQIDMLEKIIQSGRRLMNTLNSVLTISELENNQYLINKSEIDLTLFCREIKTLYYKAATSKNLDLKLELPNESLTVFSDENVLTKVTSCIIENAIKYTPQGEVKIELKHSTGKKGERCALINISDTGIGIREEDQILIFREFKQLSEGYRRDFEGLGLGLTLANRMVKLISGKITVQSELGKGSTFTLSIPIEAERENEIIQTEQITVEKDIINSSEIRNENVLANVLLIEDNPLNIEVVQRFLSKLCVVSFARDGLTAIEMAKEKDYSLIMIDINLGHGMDGVQVLEEIKKLNNYINKPIIALTGYASDFNKREFLAQGFTHYLAKPFEKRQLLGLIKEILG